jgi:hypothetical protein
MGKYAVNEGRREYAVRLGCEKGIYDFVSDYAREMGMSMSGAVRRLLLIGARCESEHGKQTMPTSYDGLHVGSTKEMTNDLYDAFKRYENDGKDGEFDWR